MGERFVTFDIREVEKFIDNEENSNTRKKTKNDMALLSSFMAKEKENRQVEEIPPQELDNYLSRFLLSVRKKNGDEYEPSTLRGFIASIERYLKKCRYSESVITGQNFARTRDSLKSKQKHLKRLGKGNKPNEASSLTPEERDILFERKEMGFSSPKALINTLWLNNYMHFGLYNKHSISHSFAALTHEISSSTLKDKICIHMRACNILYTQNHNVYIP